MSTTNSTVEIIEVLNDNDFDYTKAENSNNVSEFNSGYANQGNGKLFTKEQKVRMKILENDSIVKESANHFFTMCDNYHQTHRSA